MSNPEDLLYSASHEWAKVNGEEAVLGITHFAQESLGDITYVDMPAEGDELTAGSEFGAVESVKAASANTIVASVLHTGVLGYISATITGISATRRSDNLLGRFMQSPLSGRRCWLFQCGRPRNRRRWAFCFRPR